MYICVASASTPEENHVHMHRFCSQALGRHVNMRRFCSGYHVNMHSFYFQGHCVNMHRFCFKAFGKHVNMQRFCFQTLRDHVNIACVADSSAYATEYGACAAYSYACAADHGASAADCGACTADYSASAGASRACAADHSACAASFVPLKQNNLASFSRWGDSSRDVSLRIR